MSELIIWTYDWVPEGPRGFVRDLRLRWACEEAGLAYTVRTVAFDGRETNHLEQQPAGRFTAADLLMADVLIFTPAPFNVAAPVDRLRYPHQAAWSGPR